MLAETAQVHQGKGFALGFGLDTMLAPPDQNAVGQIAVCGTIAIPSQETNKQIVVDIELLDQDGHPFIVATPMGNQPLRVNANLRVAAPAHLPRGADVIMPFAVQFGLPLRPGRYRFRISVNGSEKPNASLPLHILTLADLGMAPPPGTTPPPQSA